MSTSSRSGVGKLTPGGDDMIAEKTSECGVATRQFRLGRVNGVDSFFFFFFFLVGV